MSSIRWFDKEHRIGIDPSWDDDSWMFVIGGAEHMLRFSDLKRILRAMRRLRDFRAGQLSSREKEKP